MHNKHLGIIAMSKYGSIDGLATEHHRSRKPKEADIQALNTRLFYDHIRQKIIPDTSIFADLVSNCDLVIHSIASISLQIFNVSRNPSSATSLLSKKQLTE